MDVAILDYPVASRNPVRPNPRRDLPLAAVVGLLLGLGLAFLRDYIDGSVRTVDEVDGLRSAPLLALIPSVPPLRGARRALNGQGSSQQRDRQDKLTEAFGQLRTSVLFNSEGSIPRSLLITSAQPGEGKTTVSANLAISLAALGRRVLLVDADTRVSAVHRAFHISRDNGLSDYLAGQLEWRDAVRQGVLPNLDVMPAGTARLNPADLLSGGAVNLMVNDAEAEYDFVILDAPAVLINAPDARILAPTVGGTLLVVRSGATARDLVRRTISQIPNLVGIVLNDLDPRQFPAYYREYGAPPSDAQHANGGAARYTHETGSQHRRGARSASMASGVGEEI
jgi:capsular exopolysaccharide synthesis family protein